MFPVFLDTCVLLKPSDTHVVSQDTFLLDQLDLRPADVIDALRR